MPITQERMILLVEESESAFEAIDTMIKDIRATLDSTHMNERQKLATIGATIAMTLPQPLYTIIERRHFKRFAKHNSRMKDKMYNKRHRIIEPEDDGAPANPPKPAFWQSPNAPGEASPAERAAPGLTQRIVDLSSQSIDDDVARRQQESLDMVANEFPKRPIAPKGGQ
jgi:hypothetical protein